MPVIPSTESPWWICVSSIFTGSSGNWNRFTPDLKCFRILLCHLVEIELVVRGESELLRKKLLTGYFYPWHGPSSVNMKFDVWLLRNDTSCTPICQPVQENRLKSLEKSPPKGTLFKKVAFFFLFLGGILNFRTPPGNESNVRRE